MPPPLPSHHRGMTANPLKPVGRYRPGKPVAEEPSSSEDEEEEDVEAQKEQERRQAEAQRRRQQAPKASSFPAAVARKAQEESDEDEEGFETEDDEDEPAPAPKAKPAQPRPDQTETRSQKPAPVAAAEESEEEESEEESEEEEEEESSSEDEAPRRMLIRPTFIKKDKRGNTAAQGEGQKDTAGITDSAAADEVRRAQRQEKADQLVRDQLEKEAIARSAKNRAWDDDELVEADEEAGIDDRDGVDPDAEYAAWKLRELKRIKREREAIEEAEKEREEIERRRNLTAEERDREDREFIAKQKEEREATRGQTGFMQRYFHKGAFFRDDLEREGLDQRNLMGRQFVDETSRETLPQYMQVRDMTKLGKKGRTRYRDLKTEDTGRFGDGYENRRRDNAPPVGITDERFMPDRKDDRPRGPTGANASAVQPRRRSRSRSPRRDRDERSRSRERRKRSPSPYEERDKRRRVDSS